MLASVNPATITTLEKVLMESTAKSAQETREFFTFPALHENIARAVLPEISPPWFQEDDDEDSDDQEQVDDKSSRWASSREAAGNEQAKSPAAAIAAIRQEAYRLNTVRV
ncbi:MAG: hypothetical protein M1823_008397, partial [Watsoniomyces obsoletus]